MGHKVLSDDSPRSMRDAGVRERRRGMLHLPHVAPLAAYAAELRKRGPVEVPEFDPLDGGINAQVLFLFEKPGPMTAREGKRIGSGFISRNNDDPTAEATFHFMNQAGLARQMTVIWNVIPWWNKTVMLTRSELRDGVGCVASLIELLPRVRAVVLVGARAGAARPYLTEKTGGSIAGLAIDRAGGLWFVDLEKHLAEKAD